MHFRRKGRVRGSGRTGGRLLGALLLACLGGGTAWAGDAVHLRNGGVLRGAIVEESDEAVVLHVGTGTLTLARSAIAFVERHTGDTPEPAPITRRDEWFLILHRKKVVGWRHFVHLERPHRTHIEDHTVFFRPGGGDDIAVRRVEIADDKGNPVEFLHSETYGSEQETVAGHMINGKLIVLRRRAGKQETLRPELPEGWELSLPAWARFQAEARPGEVRTVQSLDTRRLKPVLLMLRRGPDAPAPDAAAGFLPCRALEQTRDGRILCTLYRPGEGSLSEELNGSTLVAQRVSPERVARARKEHALPDPARVRERNFPRRPGSDLSVKHTRAGLSLERPDAGWRPTLHERERGLLLSLRKLGVFASFEVFGYKLPAPDADIEACLERARARLRLTATSVEETGTVQERTVSGLPARVIAFRAQHRGEDLRGLLCVVRAPDRYLVFVGASPERWWRYSRPAVESLLNSCKLVD